MSLARKGRDVLLLDRAEFPRDKICGDAIPAGGVRLLKDFGAGDKVDAAIERGEFYPVTKLFLASPRGIEMHADLVSEGADSIVAPRFYFDALLQQHAVDCGAEFKHGQVQEPLIENGQVVGVKARFNGTTKELRSRMVIAADGVSSVIARNLREDKHPPQHAAVAVRAYIEGIEIMPREVEFYLYKSILPGYAWIFPTENESANIGLGMRTDVFKRTKSNLNDMLDEFLALPSIAKRLKPGWKLTGLKRWPLKFGSMKDVKRVYNGALLIGDAGALINPLTGGGIHNSMISARIAADVIDLALDANNTTEVMLQPYEVELNEALWDNMRRSYFMQRWLMRSPLSIDVLIKLAGSNNKFAETFLTKL
jgi:geranylgeranyl reductase family protein